ncbi:UNVERIFIED_CONTAM: hypothetical protein PYX00_004222 [Menopon gallinae]|uniref:Uncharacterized protein n=1 Tax=Menopon gallinae TaxID=328185 RepID=A0AAW2I2X8_9NEOP
MKKKKEKKDTEQVSFENIITVPPDGGWGWVVVVAAFYCIFVMDGIANTFGLLIPVFQKEFDTTLAEVSLINSLFTGFYFLFGPVASSLSNRFGFRAIIISGSIVSACGIGISVFNKSVHFMFFTYGFVGGLGFSLMYINVLLTVGFYFERWRALATGITVSASGAGTFSFAPAVQALLELYTWKYIFLGYAALVFLCSVVAMCFRPLHPIHLKVEIEEGTYLKKQRELGKTVQSNANYPTAADLPAHVGSVNESKISVPSSTESLEIRGLLTTMRESSIRFPRRPGYGRSVLDIIPSVPEIVKKERCRRFCPCCRKCCRKTTGVRPLYRDDIFYDGSINRLQHNHELLAAQSNRSVVTMMATGHLNRISNRSLLYNMSVSRLPTKGDILEEQSSRCHVCPESLTRALRTMFDFSIMKKGNFLLFLSSTTLLTFGSLVPIQFSYVRVVEMNILSKEEASLLLAAIGITNTVGRIVCGLLGSIRRLDIILLHILFLIFGALLNIAVVFFFDKTSLFVYATLYGFVLAEQGCMRSVILVKLVGLESLTNAFGILLLFLGLSTIAGIPLAGYIKQLTGTYDYVFYYSSGIIALSALIVTPLVFRRRSQRDQQPL